MGATSSTTNNNKFAVPREQKIITVYFCGTDGVILHGYTQISIFASLTIGFDLSDHNGLIPTEHKYYKFGFDGCGMTNGTMGAIFATGLKEQCELVEKAVSYFIDQGFKVTLNCLGLSRGGMATIMLTKMLATIPKIHLEMNILLFDPVPGNLILSGKVDLLNATLTNQCMDLSESTNLHRVLALYPYLPLPDLAFHAPILPVYPTHCEVEEDVTLGCHQGALFFPNNLETQLSFLRIRTFLSECGTQFLDIIDTDFPISEENCLNQIQVECTTPQPSIRYCHSRDSATIVRRAEADYLNRHHCLLRKKLGLDVPENPRLLLDIEREYNTVQSFT